MAAKDEMARFSITIEHERVGNLKVTLESTQGLVAQAIELMKELPQATRGVLEELNKFAALKEKKRGT